MIVDAFLYAGEREMAELRRLTLGPHADAQVAVSCNLTYQGEPAGDIAPPPDGVEWVTLAVEPSDVPFGIEAQHRSRVPEAVRGLGVPGDAVLLVSDVDEIVDPSTLPEVVAGAGPTVVPMRMHAFAVDYMYPLTWWGTTASRVDAADPHAQRSVQRAIWPEAGHGWHLSWMGTMEQRRRKLATFSHPELADVDVHACWRDAVHVTGTRLTRLTVEQMADLSWPAPLFNGFEIPKEWWAP